MAGSGAHSDRNFVERLLHPGARATTVGPVRWVQTKGERREGRVSVIAMAGAEEAELLVTINRLRCEQMWLVYLAGGANVRRLCVNHEHRPFPRVHKHRAEGEPPNDCYEPDDIPEVPLSPDVSPELYREVFEAFAAECHVTIGDDFEWAPPWEV